MRVLGFTRGTGWDELDGPQYYRTFLPLREVHRHANGIEAEIFNDEHMKSKSDDDLEGYDVYTMCRMYHEDCEPFLDRIHSMGGLLVLDSDDDLTETYRLVSGRGREFCKVLAMADYVTVSTPPLADLFSQYTQKPPVVLRNCVDAEWMIETSGKARRIADGLTVGFSGSPTHYIDWYLPSVPFQRIARDFDIVPLLHGEMPRYLKYVSEDTMQLGGVPYSIYPVLMAQFDVVLCAVSLTDSFNTGKSAVKALEAMCCGAVPICSRFGPYMEIAEQGAPVVIVEEESHDGWYEAMSRVIEDEAYRLDLKSRGPAWVLENRDMVSVGHKQWSEFYNGVID